MTSPSDAAQDDFSLVAVSSDEPNAIALPGSYWFLDRSCIVRYDSTHISHDGLFTSDY